MSALAFAKYEGLGNDFLLVDASTEDEVAPAAVRRLCDRRRGVGGDGVIVVLPPRSEAAAAAMVVQNADGTRPEMCGNGLRCVALHVARRQGAGSTSLVIDTDSGPLLCEVDLEPGGRSALVQAEVGTGSVDGELRLELEGTTHTFVRVSIGNPHAILFDSTFDEAAIDRQGPVVSAAVPGGTNVEHVRFRGPKEIDLVVWERGVGRTLACGTGAAATAVAAAKSGRTPFDEPVTVHLPGGALEITVRSTDLRAVMRGPARRVFAGEVHLP